MIQNITSGVAVWEQDITIPTYPVGEPDKNPMFLEKRVYQGSSGRVYPHTVIDKIADEKEDRVYHAVFLENKYLHIMILPELGGRIQRALDKTNQYDFVYYNHVIKPALVGLNGPWISGGIEFNWPQHHRPSTFDPVHFSTRENPDGSVTVSVSEIENMFRTKGMTSFTLYPDKAYLEIKAQIYNRTNTRQTFLWWANPAIAVNDYTQSIFPPDVNAVMDHGKRDVSSFPIATGTYYKQDYSAGVDISRYKNIPVPTSYMAYHSDYDFVGGYDYREQAGILHIADHHIAPGKKQWTWGCGDFGKAWDRNLTDSDGPYIELMTGCFTDNQPDFTWLEPYEEKVFTQYFMPYKTVGMIKNATLQAAVGLELEGCTLHARCYTTGDYSDAQVVVTANGAEISRETVTLSPTQTYDASFTVPSDTLETACAVAVYSNSGALLVEYHPSEKPSQPIPDPAKAMPLPCDCRTTEDLFLYGTHLEQYRHATFEPADYYLEGLRRDSSDIRLNVAYGNLLVHRGRFSDALPYFEAAIQKLTRSSPQPYYGEPLYSYGLALRYLERETEAYDAFYKCIWNGDCQDKAFYQMACIACKNGDFEQAQAHLERSLCRNTRNMKARTLQTAILRLSGQTEAAALYAKETLSLDPMDFAARLELSLLAGHGLHEGVAFFEGNYNECIEVALEYSDAGLYRDALKILNAFAEQNKTCRYPLVFYYLAYYAGKLNDAPAVQLWLSQAANANSDGCFPHRLEDIAVLRHAVEQGEADYLASYCLGNLWYDKKQYEQAISCWEHAAAMRPDFPTAHRNLSLAYYNKRGDASAARRELETAFEADLVDARVLMELDCLCKKMGESAQERLNRLESNRETVLTRDDLYLEYVTLHNLLGHYETAKQLLENRKFHPWEGGEGKVPAQYVHCRIALAKQALDCQDYSEALALLQEATVYPHNLGEGKLENAQENNIYYDMGRAYAGMGDSEHAARCWQIASNGISEPASMMYYNDAPPETIFYQGLALRAAGREPESLGRFNRLRAYGEKHLSDKVAIDYFAVSLPDLQIFDEDLSAKNRIHCLYMMALGNLGLGNATLAASQLSQVLLAEPCHLGALNHLSLLDGACPS